MRVRAFDHLVLRVADVERSLAWYTVQLGLPAERVDEWRAGTALFPSVRIDEGTIIDLLTGERSGENVDHLCLVVEGVDPVELARSDHFDVTSGPTQVWGARGIGTSVYVRDPDGNVVELRSYPDEP